MKALYAFAGLDFGPEIERGVRIFIFTKS